MDKGTNRELQRKLLTLEAVPGRDNCIHFRREDFNLCTRGEFVLSVSFFYAVESTDKKVGAVRGCGEGRLGQDR